MSRYAPIILLLLTSACAPSDRSIPEGLTSEGAMHEAIRAVVPPGSSITDAQERLQAAGFECVYQWHAPWGNDTNQTYLYCHREEGTWLTQQRWQVAVMMRGVTVGEVRVAGGMVGP